jgi:hypothetical protein
MIERKRKINPPLAELFAFVGKYLARRLKPDTELAIFGT